MSEEALIADLKQRARAGDAVALQALRDRGFFAAKPRVEENWPVSAAQRRLWIIDRMMPGLPVYNIATALLLDGPLQVAALRRAVEALVQRHEALRTRFCEVAGEPRQVIGAGNAFAWHERDVSGAADPLAEARAIAAREAATPFDLAQGPLFRSTVLRLAPERHVLLWTVHHIISDAWSAGVMNRELAVLYGAEATGNAPSLTPLTCRYRDFAYWQNGQLAGAAGERMRAAWVRRLGGERAVLGLPTDFARPAVQSAAGRTFQFGLGRELSDQLTRLGQARGATAFMTLVALLKTLLARYTEQEDISVGTPVAGRERVEWEGLVGFFVNTLVLRDRVERTATFGQLLARVRETCLEAYEQQAYPFDRLVDDLEIERDFSRSPLFDVSVQLLDGGTKNAAVGALRLAEFDHGFAPAKCDLSYDFFTGEDGFDCSVTYHRELFAEPRIRRMATHLRELASGIVADPERPLGDYELLTAEERRQVLIGFNPPRSAPPDETLTAWFTREAAAHPAAVAVRHNGESWSYADLETRANRLASVMRCRGVEQEVVVAVMLERGLPWLQAMLGVMKAGGIYLPIDPGLPRARIATMLADSGARLVVTTRALCERAGEETPLWLIDEAGDELASASPAAVEEGPAPADGAYLIYTSGSTGAPKGVLVEHRGVVNTVRDQIGRLQLSSADRVLQFASASFDASQFEIWNAWLSGATLVVTPDATRTDPAAFLGLLHTERVTVAVLPPSFVRSLARAELPLRVLFTAGEAAIPEDVRHYARRLTYVNGYGPTEASICSSVQVVSPDESLSLGVPIGRPLVHTRAYVLDPARQPVPIGVAGELWVAGAGVARGYWRRPELTAERFAPDPFTDGGRMYRTGDRCRWRDDGILEYLGRADSQIKLRGFRIEPGEIEAALTECPGVREAAVLLRQDEGKEPLLVAYVVPEPNGGLAVDALRTRLRERLPDYMVPAAFVTLAAMPVSTAGKIDRRALPAPDFTPAVYQAPRDDVERAVAGLFQDVLRRERVGVNEGFFQSGGNSLLAIQVLSRVRDTFKSDLPIPRFFDQPTVAGVAAALREDPVQRERVEKIAGLVARLAAMSPAEKQLLLAQQRSAAAKADGKAAAR